MLNNSEMKKFIDVLLIEDVWRMERITEATRKRVYQQFGAPPAGSVIELGNFCLEVREDTVSIHRR